MTGAPPPTRSMVADQISDLIQNVRAHADIVNQRWGFNRLPHIVSIDLMERFKRQKKSWDLACFECCASMMPKDLERVRKLAEAMKRAYAALEAEAQALGHVPAPPGVWGFELRDGTPIVLVRTRAELGNVEREPGAQVWCLEEIGEIIARFPELVVAKDAFPDAEIIQIGPSQDTIELVDDELADIPFGG